MKTNKEFLVKAPFVIVNSIYLLIGLILPWLNSMLDAFFQLQKVVPWQAHFVAAPFILFNYLSMYWINRNTPNSKTSKKKIFEQFLSFHGGYKAAIVYILAVAFLTQDNQTIGVALLIPFYMYVINFYTSVSSGKVKDTWA